jgi:hypothetical protein
MLLVFSGLGMSPWLTEMNGEAIVPGSWEWLAGPWQTSKPDGESIHRRQQKA